MDDLDALIARVAEQGMTLADEEVLANGVREAAYRDADGNEFGFGWRRDIAGGFQPAAVDLNTAPWSSALGVGRALHRCQRRCLDGATDAKKWRIS